MPTRDLQTLPGSAEKDLSFETADWDRHIPGKAVASPPLMAYELATFHKITGIRDGVS
jgi:hypothetical protein